MKSKPVLAVVGMLAVGALSAIQSRAETIHYEVSDADIVVQNHAEFPITGSFDWSPQTGLADWQISLSGWASLSSGQGDGALAVVTANNFKFTDSQTLFGGNEAFVVSGIFGTALPTTIGNSTTFSGTFTDAFGPLSDPALIDAFTVTGTVTASALDPSTAAPEPGSLASVGLGACAAALFCWWRGRSKKLAR